MLALLIFCPLFFVFFLLTDCKPHWRNWTFSHYKHNLWLWPLLLGQNHGSKAAELPRNFWNILKTCAAGCHEQERRTSWLSSWFCLNQLVAMLWNLLHREVMELLSFLCVCLRDGCEILPVHQDFTWKALKSPTLPKKGKTSSCAKKKKKTKQCAYCYNVWMMFGSVLCDECMSTLPYTIVYLLSISFKCVSVCVCVNDIKRANDIKLVQALGHNHVIGVLRWRRIGCCSPNLTVTSSVNRTNYLWDIYKTVWTYKGTVEIVVSEESFIFGLTAVSRKSNVMRPKTFMTRIKYYFQMIAHGGKTNIGII